jgi:serine protease Do
MIGTSQAVLRRSGLAWIIVFFWGFLACSARAESFAPLIDAIRSSVVAVGTYSATNSPPAKFLGTGFAVGDGHWIVTNHHVIPNKLDAEHFEKIAVFSGRGRKGQVHIARVEMDDLEHDLVLLAIDGEPLPALHLSDKEMPREGDEVIFTGFPIGMVLGLYPVTHRGMISAITPIVIPSPTSNQLTVAMIHAMETPFNVLQLDATAYPGNSGSPVLDASSGEVVGVINMVFVKSTKEAVLRDPSGISYAIPARYVSELLEKATSKAHATGH